MDHQIKIAPTVETDVVVIGGGIADWFSPS